jgi:hypothetical protein
MKRVLLAIASVAIMASSAWAFPGPIWQPTDFRNESYIVQTGQVSWASVTQFGDQSYSDISQKGTHDKATVIQTSDCCFTGGCGCGSSWAGIPIFTEAAYQNYSKINQFGAGFHDAYVSQDGDGNKSFIDQSGKKDTAKVIQDGGFNYSEIDQKGWGMNKAEVTQIGDLNTSYVDQNSGLNTALVTQVGYGNLSNIEQGGYCGFGGSNLAIVSQVGYQNFSDIMQSGGGNHTALVSQTNMCFTNSVPYCK